MLPENKDILTVHEIAEMLRVDDTTVRRWIQHGILKAVNLPSLGKRQSYRVKRETVEKLLQGETPTPLVSVDA